ncbi:NACHT domain-containing protein [Bradyrhizobium sp.]|uniref:NACHT domain-containing protein n=1 Tax=Bradyrhizobium sp. TaxID=376 RepID=UPI00391BE07E
MAEHSFVNVGEAAHITAAAPGGKRHDPSLTQEERRAASNGIWLCELCAKLIDTDEERFTVEHLRRWKHDAEARALRDIATAAPGTYRRPVLVVELDEEDRAFLLSLALPQEDQLEAVLTRMLPAARRDIATFRNTKEWPSHAIALSLTLRGNGGSAHAVTIKGLANGLDAAETLNLVAPPGTGKSTTLVQLAETLVEAGEMVPGLVPLGEWSDRREDFFTFLTRRNALGTFRPQHFMQLAYHGRFALLLDGWNELDPAARVAATRLLKALRRDYPLLGIVIGTRRNLLPISGAVVEVDPLSESQQLELAGALRGQEGEALVDQAWRTPGVRDLVTIPLYLTALLRSTPGARFPQTKEEVLRLFVTQHEEEPQKAAILQKELLGFHGDMLTGLSVEANRAANTVLSDTSANRVIADVGAQLAAAGQFTIPPQPATAIEVLVSNHLLIRASSGGISFQHQQFQEWYASLDVGRIMRAAANGDAAARTKLRDEILNWPAWEESVLFACERLSRENAAGAQAVAGAIRETLGIDPMLAAEMIFRSSPGVWALIGAETTAFAARWHTARKVDRAARFMMTTGRPEFAPQIWPLISNPDQQVYLAAVRSPSRFRVSVLGDGAEQKLAALPLETRKHVVAEIASYGGFDSMELAVRVAKADPSADAVLEVLQALQFRRADRMVTEILQTASDAVWELAAGSGYPDELADPVQNQRLAGLRGTQIETETDPVNGLRRLAARQVKDAETETRIEELIAAPSFPARGDVAAHALQEAQATYPAPVRRALQRRIAARMELPFRAREFLAGGDALDEGPVVDALLDAGTPEMVMQAAFVVVGPKTIGAMIDRLFKLHEAYEHDRNGWGRAEHQAERDEYGRLRTAVGASRDDLFLTAVLERAETDDPVRIEFLADLMRWHGRPGGDEERSNIQENMRAAMVCTLQRWMNTLLESRQANRHHLAAVSRAMIRFPDPQFVPGLRQMLERDLTDWARARVERANAAQRCPSSPAVTHANTKVYRSAVVAFANDAAAALKEYLPDPRFGLHAAGALAEIWNRDHPSGKAPIAAFGQDYSRAKQLEKQRREAPETLPTCDDAEAIFNVARSLGTSAAESRIQLHAIALAVMGLGMPHGSKRAEIDNLLTLPVPYAAKQRLLIASAMAGEVLRSDVLVAGFDELLEASKKESWRLDENRGELMNWIELFAFSDHPQAVLGLLDRLPEQYRYVDSLDRLLSALAKSPHENALEVLQALARRDPRLLARHEWARAVIKVSTEKSGQTLLKLVCEGELGNAGGVDSFYLSRQLAHLGEEFPALKEEMLQSYQRLNSGPPKSILESALIEFANPAIIRALVQGYAAEHRPYDGGLAHALRNAALGRRSVEGWTANAYEVFSVSLADLRRELFGVALAKDAQSLLAEACLVEIEELRDEHGRVDDEPRHPDISSGQPWPIIR